MDNVHTGDTADEIAVAVVQALARGEATKALSLIQKLEPLIEGRVPLQARTAAWSAQAHQILGDLDGALECIRTAIALAQQANDLRRRMEESRRMIYGDNGRPNYLV